MKQLITSLKDGTSRIETVPAPKAGRGALLIDTHNSVVSAGTERMLVAFGQSNWVSRARQQPDKVKMVLDKAKTDGLVATYDAVMSKIDQPLALGYCNAGVVREIGDDVRGFAVGDRVVSNGAHAELVSVPTNLCAKIPDNVDFETASFTVLGAIGLQGIRLANPTMGEYVAVIGLGLIGLLVVQMLRAQGCRVLGIDFDETRLAQARAFGAETVKADADVESASLAFTRGQGIDAVIITAATQSNEPMHQAAQISRKRGRIVLVGVVGLSLSRDDFFEKELTFQVSFSYGPGRNDPAYEEGGHDYPLGFVRWTEQRNFEAVLDLMASGALDVAPLISHRFAFEEGVKAMDLLTAKDASLGIVLRYDTTTQSAKHPEKRIVALDSKIRKSNAPAIGFIGAGNYASRELIPAFKKSGARLASIVSAGGVSAVHAGKKFGFAEAATDNAPILADDTIDAVVIATRHNAHASQVIAALEAGKHVFCEKPLCFTQDELATIETTARDRPAQLLMVGFNRRFAPHIVRLKQELDTHDQPKVFMMTVNAGYIPAEHWVHDPEQGGGRIVGEACHFIDLLRHLAGASIIQHSAARVGAHHAFATYDDKASLTLQFADGSLGVINYLANGHPAVPKERLEVFVAGRVFQFTNFLRLRGFGRAGFRSRRAWVQDKGQKACAKAFIQAIKNGGDAPIPLDEVLEVSRVAIALAEALR